MSFRSPLFLIRLYRAGSLDARPNHARSYRVPLLPWLALAALVPFVAACDESGDPRGAHTTNETSITLTDAIGTTVVFDAPPRRVVSLAPNLTEIVAYAGGEDRLVARTDFCNYPPSVDTIPSIGSTVSFNYERIVALKPDLVLMSIAWEANEREYRKLERLKIKAFALDAATVSGAINSIDTVAMILGTEEQTRPKTDGLRRTIDSIATLAKGREPVKVFVVIDDPPLITVSSGFIDEQIRIAGGVNIAAGEPIAYPQFSREEVLRRDPDVILYPTVDTAALEELLANYPEWRTLRAVREDRVYVINPDEMTRPGPRMVESIVRLYRILHGGSSEF